MHADTEGVPTDMLAAPWLRRSVSFSDLSSANDILVVNGLQVKICLNTYKLFYMIKTEDTLVRNKTSRVVTDAKWKHGVDSRKEAGIKWTRNGHVTKEEQNAAAAAEAEAKQKEAEAPAPAPPTISPPPAAITTPPAESVRSPIPAPPPAPAVASPTEAGGPIGGGDVKMESPPALPAETDEAMDVEPSNPPAPIESRQSEPRSTEDVEMQDA